MVNHSGRYSLPLLLASAPFSTSLVAADKPVPNGYHVAFAHDYQQRNDPTKLHRVISPDIELNKAGEITGFEDSQGPINWNELVYDTGVQATLKWGRWTRGITGGTGLHSGHDISGAEGIRNSFRLISGPLPDSPLTDAATFSLIGGHTSPTAGEGGGTSITLLTRGNLTLNDGAESADISLSLRVASGIYSFTAENLKIERYGFSTTQPVVTSGVLCIPGCTTEITGFISGADGTEAGIAFSISNPALSKQINGVAAFTREP